MWWYLLIRANCTVKLAIFFWMVHILEKIFFDCWIVVFVLLFVLELEHVVPSCGKTANDFFWVFQLTVNTAYLIAHSAVFKQNGGLADFNIIHTCRIFTYCTTSYLRSSSVDETALLNAFSSSMYSTFWIDKENVLKRLKVQDKAALWHYDTENLF